MGDSFDVVIVGAGAAGLATAIFTARRRPTLRIAVLDGAKKLGAKILVSGGGRCNVTNVRVTPEDFFGGSRNTVRNVLRAFSAEQTVAFFRELGVNLHEEQWGKLFPDSNRAQTVLDALLDEAKRRDVGVFPGRRVRRVQRRPDGSFAVEAIRAEDGESLEIAARRVVLATGGMSLPKTGSDGGGYALAKSLGHSLVPPTPALVPLILDGEFHASLSGVAHEVEVTIRVTGEKLFRLSGPMLWTHFGASGPAMLDASRHWHRAQREGKEVAVSLSFLPGEDFQAVERRFVELAAAQPKVLVRNAPISLLPGRLIESIVSHTGIHPQITLGRLTREDRRRLVHALLEWPLPIRDSRGFTHAEVTAGGVPLSEIDPATLASRIFPGLFLVGEILDVDGRIGGFNFQWAWSSAFVAACGLTSGSPVPQ